MIGEYVPRAVTVDVVTGSTELTETCGKVLAVEVTGKVDQLD